MSVVENAKDAHASVQSVHRKVGHAPATSFFFGLAFLGAWLCVVTIQIQTSEYLMLHLSTRVAGVSWFVLWQPVLLITGQAPPTLATAWMYAWIVELVTLAFGMVLGIVLDGLRRANPWFARGFAVLGLVLIALNSWADYSSTPGGSPLLQVLAAIAIGGTAVTGLIIALALFGHALKEV